MNPGDNSDEDVSGNKEMKGLVAAAAMMSGEGECAALKRKYDHTDTNTLGAVSKRRATSHSSVDSAITLPSKDCQAKDVPASRVRRLEQNRRAAIESRRRKKVMIEELQRSVTFYTKANETLKMDNADLERRLFLVKQRVMQVQMGNPPISLKAPPEHSHQMQMGKAPAALQVLPEQSHQMQMGKSPTTLKPPPEQSNRPVESKRKSNPSQASEYEVQPQPAVPVPSAVPFPSLHQSVSPIESGRAQAQLTATQAIYETMGYPSAAARVAASTFSQFVGIAGETPTIKDTTYASVNPSDASLITKPSAPEPATPIVVQPPSEEEVGSENYVESLKKFAMQQTAAANAAAAAANAAIQALNWHKMMKLSGTNPLCVMPYAPPGSMLPTPPKPAPTRSASEEEEEEPLSEKAKS